MTVDYNCRISTIKQSKPVHNRHGIRERSKMGLGPKCGYVRLKRCWMVRGGGDIPDRAREAHSSEQSE